VVSRYVQISIKPIEQSPLVVVWLEAVTRCERTEACWTFSSGLGLFVATHGRSSDSTSPRCREGPLSASSRAKRERRSGSFCATIAVRASDTLPASRRAVTAQGHTGLGRIPWRQASTESMSDRPIDAITPGELDLEVYLRCWPLLSKWERGLRSAPAAPNALAYTTRLSFAAR